MLTIAGSELRQPKAISPLTLSDRLITLAKDAETAGYPVTAEHLVRLAMQIFDEAKTPSH
jgi:hypothetical protein